MDTQDAKIDQSEQSNVIVDSSDFWPTEAVQGHEEDFLGNLRDFYQKRRTPFVDDWTLGTAKLAPKIFFENVCEEGGFFVVNEHMAWPKVLELTLGREVYLAVQRELPLGALVSAAMNLYWSQLYALESVYLGSKPDSGVDFTKIHFTDPALATYLSAPVEEVDLQTPSSTHGLLAPHTPHTIGSGTHTAMDLDESDDAPSDSELEEDSSAGEALRTKVRVERLARRFSHKYVRLNPNALMEMFRTRPEHARPLTWRHQIDANPNAKSLTNDVTKTPIPKVSSRLMGRHRESLLMRRAEHAFNDDTNGIERAAALTALQTRSWSKVFFIALYPTLLDSLLRYTRFLLDRLLTTSAASHLFNLPQNDAESDLTLLLRISIIFRNLSQASHNLNLLVTHSHVAEIIMKFINLRKSVSSHIPEFKPILSRSLGEIQTICSSMKDFDQDILMELRDRTEETGNRAAEATSSSSDPLKVIQQLKSNNTLETIASIQFNALEALSVMVPLTKLAGTPGPVSLAHSMPHSGESSLSEQGMSIMECMPTLIEIVLNPTSKGATIFLAVESLAKLALNSNSHPMWQAQSTTSKAELISALVRFALLEDEISDWALFGAVHLALNALDLAVAQVLASSELFLNDLMLMVTNYANLPKTMSTEQYQMISYRRHTFATRSATILHRLVEFVPLNAYLLSFERAFADIYLHAPPELSNPFYRVFVEMQT
jgi:hypothetical protein